MAAEIIRTYKQSIPAMRFIGKKYSDSSHWSEWFANDWFTLIENTMDKTGKVLQDYEDWDAYIGLMRYKEKAPFEYWIGKFAHPGAKAPNGFLTIDFPESYLGVNWIYGKESEVFALEGRCTVQLLNAGMEIVADKTGAIWSFERRCSPRFTTPDEDGNIILDYCFFVK